MDFYIESRPIKITSSNTCASHDKTDATWRGRYVKRRYVKGTLLKATLREETLREGGDVVGGGWRRPVTRWRCGRLVAVERLVAGAATEGATSAGRSAIEISHHIT